MYKPLPTITAQLVFVLLALLFATSAPAEIRISDDKGNSIRLEAPAQRIVSLSPHTTELLFAAGAGELVVGAPSYSDYPEAAQKIPRIGGYNAIDFETILALQPDLVVGWHSGNGPRTIERLRELGLTVYSSEPRQLDDIPRALRRLGQLSDKRASANAAAEAFEQRLATLEQRYRDRPQVSVFYQIWHQPLMTIGGEHIINQVIALCGGKNTFANQRSLTVTISEEAVLLADPQAIIASGMGEPRPEWVENWRHWPGLQAVRDEQLFFIHPDLLQRPTPRLLDGAEQLCQALEQLRE